MEKQYKASQINTINNHNKLTIIDAFTKSSTLNLKFFKNIANMFFLNAFVHAIYDPLSSLKKQIKYAKSKNADVIIGIDMFFWSIYNNYIDNNKIKKQDVNYKKQLRQINKIFDYLDLRENQNINFVVGAIPYKPLNLYLWKLDPTKELIDIVNKKITDWIETRNKQSNGKALLVDTTDFFESPEKYADLLETTSPLLFEELVCTDLLHPSYKGQELVARAIFKTMIKSEYEIFKNIGEQFVY